MLSVPFNVGAHGLHGEELAGGDLLQRSSVENKVDAGHDIAERPRVAHIADVELDLLGVGGILGLQLVAHIVLLLLVAGEMRISPISVVRKCFSTVLPKLPVPPVMKRVLSLKLLISYLSFLETLNWFK